MVVDIKSYREKYDKFDETIVGKAVVSINYTNVNFLYPGYGRGISYDTGDIRVGYLTGYWTRRDDVTYVQVEFEDLRGSDDLGYYRFGYVNAAEYRLYTFGQDSGAKPMLQELIDNNKAIYQNNLMSAGLISFMERKGIQVSKAKRKQLFDLQNRLIYRNDKILNSTFVKVEKTEGPGAFSDYTSDLSNFMNNPRIGVAPVVIYLAVAFVFGAILSGIIVMIFRKDHTESKVDLKLSDDLMRDMQSQLSPETWEQFKKENAGKQKEVDTKIVQLEKKANQTSIQATIKTAGYAAAGILGFMLLSNLTNYSNKLNGKR